VKKLCVEVLTKIVVNPFASDIWHEHQLWETKVVIWRLEPLGATFIDHKFKANKSTCSNATVI
jgi:hypothetical protein